MSLDYNYPLSFLKAKTPEKHRMLMIANNNEHGKRIHYMSPQFVNGNWYVWFELSIKDEQYRRGR